MKLKQATPLLLAAALQVMPLCRIASVTPAAASSALAILVRCAAAIAAAAGAVHAVSGASAVISGVVKYPFSPLNPITNNAVGQVGAAFNYRIIVTGGLNNTNADYYNAIPLPPGLTIDTNVGATGFITGTPTVAGVTFPVTIYAGNTIYDGLQGSNNAIHTNITITITGGTGGSPPVFTTQPSSRTVTNGGSVTFTGVASGSPAPAYRWRRNGTNISGATLTTYTIAPVTTNDAANYSCVASNASGSATSQVATLTVLLPPSITTQPHDQTVLLGTPATFLVTDRGSPPLSYQWLKGATNIAGATNSSYSIAAAAPGDADVYSVSVSNAANALLSQPARLYVVQAPKLGSAGLQGVNLALNFTREAGALYEIFYSPVIPSTNWLSLTNYPAALTNTSESVLDPTTNSPTRFYQIRMTFP